MQELIQIGRNIAKARHKAGFTQDYVSAEAGIHRGNLSDIENGKVDPKISTLIKISKILDCSLESLLTYY